MFDGNIYSPYKNKHWTRSIFCRLFAQFKERGIQSALMKNSYGVIISKRKKSKLKKSEPRVHKRNISMFEKSFQMLLECK
jgi:hypothetical protein